MIERRRTDQDSSRFEKTRTRPLPYVGNSAGFDQYFRDERSIGSSRGWNEKNQVFQREAGGAPLPTGGKRGARDVTTGSAESWTLMVCRLPSLRLRRLIVRTLLGDAVAMIQATFPGCSVR